MIFTLLIAAVFSALFFVRNKSAFAIFYLTFLPFIVFSGQSPLLLLLSLLLGFLLYQLFAKPSFFMMIVFICVLIGSLALIHPRVGLDMGQLNSINAQRGEHPNFRTDLIARLIHNKTELVHSFIANVDKLLSPASVFASGFWHNLSQYYPLGFLFPWDIYFIYRYFKSRKQAFNLAHWIFFFPAVLILVFLSGFLYIDQATVFSFSLIYLLGLIALLGYLNAGRKVQITFAVINAIYLFYQFNISAYFKT